MYNPFLKIYLKHIVIRYDKDGIIPYLSVSNFSGLKKEENSFVNSLNSKISYFYYYYDGYLKDKIVVFLHGIGAGHTAYMQEINTLAKVGYRVLTLDYMGCDKSEGESLLSLNQPSRDVKELLDKVNPKEEIILVGHSLGGYTALNTINANKNISKAVVISPFYSIKKELKVLLKLSILVNPALRYEKKLGKFNDNFEYLKSTTDKILFIHSLDDQIVPINSSTGYIQKHINNPNLKYLITDHKKHNPNYELAAVKYMSETFSTYQKLIKENVLDTLEKKKSFMADKSAFEMTIQDEEVWKEIFSFIK